MAASGAILARSPRGSSGSRDLEGKRFKLWEERAEGLRFTEWLQVHLPHFCPSLAEVL